MATISWLGPFRHLRAEPNQYILHYKNGTLARRGAGLAYWFNPLSAAVAQVPIEDCEATFLLQERSSDFQEVTVQCTLTYRVADAERAAARVNFSISMNSGKWAEQPLERLTNLWSQRALQPARGYVTSTPLAEALRAGADAIRGRIVEALNADTEIAAMGLTLVAVTVNRVTPSADLEKALQTPTREAIQQKADEAGFQRRALAVEKERAIKENELATEIELARRHEQLIAQQGANRLLEVRQAAEAEKNRTLAEAERRTVEAEGLARDARIAAGAKAEARRMMAEARLAAEAQRLAIWREAPSHVLLGLAMQEFAGKVSGINHLNLSPDLLGQSLQQFLRDQADQ
ncbi:MAG TPA: SPFH domain-containing protein [Pirellulales bacterium]|jgi:regulator of protease activity HflC (stomatin/prohibitin superfamily)|nr:SPFH domain-containing protein [Pirellulales bacterium]